MSNKTPASASASPTQTSDSKDAKLTQIQEEHHQPHQDEVKLFYGDEFLAEVQSWDKPIDKSKYLPKSVVWSTDGKRGWYTYEYGGKSICSRTHCIESSIWSALQTFTAEPSILGLIANKSEGKTEKDEKDEKDITMFIQRKCSTLWRSMGALDLAWPIFDFEQKSRYAKHIFRAVSKNIPYMMKAIQNAKALSDAEFLWSIALKRNWKSGCAICLTEKIMGTTCSCGHTEIMILRPCGHSFCAQPCWKDFMKSKAAPPPKQRTMTTADGQRFLIMGSGDYRSNVSDDGTSFECPLCRTHTTSVFHAENVAFGDNNLFKGFVRALSNTIIEELGIYDC